MSQLNKKPKKKKVRLEPRNILYVTTNKIPEKNRHNDLYYYEMRHGESDRDTPVTIEKFVLVNFYGTIITAIPLELTDEDEKDPYLTLKPKERQYLRERMAEQRRSIPDAKD